MLPLLPFSSLTRTPKFTTEEWNTYFNTTSPIPAQNVQGGWKGILYANLALVDPKSAWSFFSQRDFDPAWIDGGASRTWYLAWCAGEFDAFWFWVGFWGGGGFVLCVVFWAGWCLLVRGDVVQGFGKGVDRKVSKDR